MGKTPLSSVHRWQRASHQRPKSIPLRSTIYRSAPQQINWNKIDFSNTVFPLPVMPPTRTWGICFKSSRTSPARLCPRETTYGSRGSNRSCQGIFVGKVTAGGATVRRICWQSIMYWTSIMVTFNADCIFSAKSSQPGTGIPQISNS